jgi:hypothetical protein
MADSALSPVTHKPKPPRAPASAGVRSNGSVEGNELLLGAHRKNVSSKKSPSIAGSESGKGALEAEVDELKRQLRESEKRLSTPVRGSRRPRDSLQTANVSLQGERYNASPYEPVEPRIMWYPFEDDPEVKDHLEKLRQSEERIAHRHEVWSHEWVRAQRDINAKIEAPIPPVFSARDDATVLKLASLADQFALTGQPSPRRGENAGRAESPSKQSDPTRYERTYSPANNDPSAGNSRSMSRANSRATRRTSSINVLAEKLLSSFGMADAVDIVLPSPEDVVNERVGDILGTRFVLKRDLFDAAFARRDTVGVMGGAPAFRMIPRFNIGAVSQAHLSGVKTILNEIAKQWDGPVVWINLREEPVVYINNRSYIVRSAVDPLEPLATPGIKAARLEDLEEKLRHEVLKEGSRFGGNVIVHKETAAGTIDAQWEAVEEGGVGTLRSMFDGLAKAGYDVRYNRLPVTPHDAISTNQFDAIFEICERHPKDPIIANCQTGRGRSTVAMIVAALVRFYQHNRGASTVSTHVSLLRREEFVGGVSKLAQLVAMLPEGQEHERRVSIMCELTGKASNLVDRIIAAFKTDVTLTGVALLNRFCHLVAFSAYCDARLHRRSTTLTFSKWLQANSVLDAFLASLGSHEVVKETLGAGTHESQHKSTTERHGDVLLRGVALMSRPSPSEARAPIPGVVALRQPHMHVPILTCGGASATGREALLELACETFPAASRVDWIDVRAEPHVYVNGTPYAAVPAASIFTEPFNTAHMTSAAIEEMERRLKNDVIDEVRHSNGMLEVVVANVADKTSTATSLKVHDVKTPKEYAARFTCAKNVAYHRVPFTVGRTFNSLSVHPMIDVAASSPTDAIAVIEDSIGGVRSTIATSFFVMGRLAQRRPLNSVCTPDAVREALSINDFAASIATDTCFGGAEEQAIIDDTHSTELLVAANLAQALAAGTLLMTTEAVTRFCGRGFEWNLLDRVASLAADVTASVGERRTTATHEALGTVVMYLHVYLSAVYITEVLGGRTKHRYDEWVASLTEIGLLIEKMREHPKDGLKFISPQNLFLDTDVGPVARRRGNVLTSNFGLKADHFPGAIRKNMRPQVPGVPNFRKVDHTNVYGVGIPTRRGILNLLRVLGAEDTPLDLHGESEADPEIVASHPRVELFHPGQQASPVAPRGRVIWVNMREEPLLFVGDRPFVLRDLANPYVNVELTGITPERIEAIEAAMQADCVADAAKYNNQFLTHDEITPGVMGGLWEPGTPESIQTLRQIYDNAATKGARVTFVRLPVTDEQMPEIRDFDILVQALLPDIIAASDFPDGESLSLVFNCQMGRGRTTTGMIVGSMLIGLVQPSYYDKLRDTYPQLYPADQSKWANGFYTVVNELLRILVDGRDAKTRVDLVINACDAMQNLRTAIEVFKQQYESPDASESARGRALHHGQHYLMRYFFLVVLNSYLHEAWDPETRRLKCTFVEYMEPRDELRHFSGRCELK